MVVEKVRYTELLPNEFRKRLADKPIAYLPLGTLEWHGEHLPLGSDAIISEGLMVEAARRLGGIVLPSIHLGPDRSIMTKEHGQLQGMDFVASSSPNRQLDGNCYWVSDEFFNSLIDVILEQIRRTGFKAVFADGHGPSRTSWVQQIEDRGARFGLKLFGVEETADLGWKSQVDHAAKNETSLVMALKPELVDLTMLPTDRSIWPVAVDGEDPRGSSSEHGQTCIELSIGILERMFNEAKL